MDAAGPASTLIPEITDALKAAGVTGKLQDRELTVTSTREHAQACGLFVDLVDQRALRHLGQGMLDRAVDGAVKRKLGDSWLWSRKDALADICPLVAVTLALWGVQTHTAAPATVINPYDVDLSGSGESLVDEARREMAEESGGV